MYEQSKQLLQTWLVVLSYLKAKTNNQTNATYDLISSILCLVTVNVIVNDLIQYSKEKTVFSLSNSSLNFSKSVLFNTRYTIVLRIS